MKNKSKFVIVFLIVVDIILLLSILLAGRNFVIFNPRGTIAFQERNLILTYITLALSIVVPVFITTFLIARKYRSGNASAKYNPEWEHSKLFELGWWVIPTVIILMLGTITWRSTHALDPSRSLNSTVKPITIQVVALRWKWLFIYPEQNIATVNFIQFPEGTPINFELTADAPMSSFWIPQLGGQMYAMTGMATRLHLEATSIGNFNGSAAEINGAGFSGMKFIARASSQVDFDSWVQSVRSTTSVLNLDEYDKLAKPSQDNPVVLYSSTDPSLYNKIMMKFMPPEDGNEHTEK